MQKVQTHYVLPQALPSLVYTLFGRKCRVTSNAEISSDWALNDVPCRLRRYVSAREDRAVQAEIRALQLDPVGLFPKRLRRLVVFLRNESHSRA